MFHPHHHHHRRFREAHELRRRFWRPRTRIGLFVRHKLRRRIFAWFTGGLAATGLMVGLVLTLLMRLEEPSWMRTFEGGRAWLGEQFGKVWDDPVAREAYAQEMVRSFDATVELSDAVGRPLAEVGGPCGSRHFVEFPVLQRGVQVGAGRVCMHHGGHTQVHWWVAFVAGLAAIWLASGKVARRLAGPLDELVEVVERIGAGDLKARSKVGCYQPDEIGLVAEAVNDMAARIEKQMADQRELLATVSHEMRTPLARLRIISEIARETGASAKTFDDLDREVVEMDSLVGELLASSRVEFGQLSLRALSVRDLCAEAVERAGIAPEALRLNGERDALQADPTLLHRALANLFDNARKHAKGVDTFEVTVDDRRVRFEVGDRGPGITGDPQALFRKFTRGEGGADTGLGLGLALVKRIAEAHGGDVFARNRDGGGATFGFEIDIAPRTGAAAPPSQPAPVA